MNNKPDLNDASWIVSEESNMISEQEWKQIKFLNRLYTTSYVLMAVGAFGILTTSREFGNDFNHAFWILFTGISLYVVARMTKVPF